MTDLAGNQQRYAGAEAAGGRSDPAATPDEDEVTEAIIMASRAMVAIAIRSLGDSHEDVTLPQYRTLVVLTYGKRRLADLAEALAVSPSTATRMCDRLVRKGLITRSRDEIDRREVNLEVTPAGRKVVGDVIERRRSEVRSLLEGVPVDARRQLVDSLYILAAAAGQSPEPHWSPGWHE